MEGRIKVNKMLIKENTVGISSSSNDLNMNEFDSISEQSVPRIVVINPDDTERSGEFKCMKMLERNRSDVKAVMK